jgi:hypothetical protein
VISSESRGVQLSTMRSVSYPWKRFDRTALTQSHIGKTCLAVEQLQSSTLIVTMSSLRRVPTSG